MTYTLRNVLVAAALGLVAVVLTFMFVQSSADKARKGSGDTTVYVATKDIMPGTSGKDLAASVEKRSISADEAAVRAVTDVGSISALSVDVPIYEGQQLTQPMFKEQISLDHLTQQLAGNERAMMVPLGGWQGLGDHVNAGDHVDIFASRTENDQPMTWVVARNVEVLKTPGTGDNADSSSMSDAPGDSKPYLLRVSDKVAEDLIWANSHADENKLVFILRPEAGAKDSKLIQPLTSRPVNN